MKIRPVDFACTMGFVHNYLKTNTYKVTSIRSVYSPVKSKFLQDQETFLPKLANRVKDLDLAKNYAEHNALPIRIVFFLI